jgi:hypothetical protein
MLPPLVAVPPPTLPTGRRPLGGKGSPAPD